MALSSRIRQLFYKVLGHGRGEELCDLLDTYIFPAAGGAVSGDTTFSGDVTFSSAANYTPATVTYAATTDLDLLSNAIQTVTLTGDVTITTSNKAAGRSLLVRLIASGGIRTFTALPSWVWVGGTAPASLASGKTALLSLTCFGSADTDIVAAYAVES